LDKKYQKSSFFLLLTLKEMSYYNTIIPLYSVTAIVVKIKIKIKYSTPIKLGISRVTASQRGCIAQIYTIIIIIKDINYGPHCLPIQQAGPSNLV
jgi:hypothetical protein